MFFNHHNCRIYISLDYSGKGTKSFDVLTGDQELEVRTATYGPEIDQSQRAKSVSRPCTKVYYCTFLRMTPAKIELLKVSTSWTQSPSNPGWKGHLPSQDTLGEPTFLTFLWKTHRTVSMRNTDLARLELEGPPA